MTELYINENLKTINDVFSLKTSKETLIQFIQEFALLDTDYHSYDDLSYWGFKELKNYVKRIKLDFLSPKHFYNNDTILETKVDIKFYSWQDKFYLTLNNQEIHW